MKKLFLIILLLSILLSSCKGKEREAVNMLEDEKNQVGAQTVPASPEPSVTPSLQTGDFEPSEAGNPEEKVGEPGEQSAPRQTAPEAPDQNTDPQRPDNAAQSEEQISPNKYIGPKLTGVTAQMQTAAFWIGRNKAADEMILDRNEIAQYNAANFERLPFLSNLLDQPQTLPGDDVRQWVQKLSITPSSTRYDGNGKEYQAADYETMKQNLNLEGIPANVPVQYGLTVKRELMRTWPSSKSSFSRPSEQKIDYFVETAVYPAEPVSIYHTSKDGKWLFAGIYHYRAWIPAESVALCTKDELSGYLDNQNKLHISAAKLFTIEAADPRISRMQLDMGIALPIENENAQEYTVKYPVRDDSGNLKFASLKLPQSSEVTEGYMDYTTAGVLNQAFKFIGEVYGWGGMNNARDCTSFLLDTYRSFGLLLPRNSDQQEQLTGAISLKGKDRSERLRIIEGLNPGSALYMPGHAMMYLGEYDSRHYIIHDVTNVYEKQGGELKQIALYQVAVTPLEVFNSKGTEFIMLLSSVVELE